MCYAKAYYPDPFVNRQIRELCDEVVIGVRF